jgi:4-amino-4-deoxy-L-arabinose transferase-like glycosyltransferase
LLPLVIGGRADHVLQSPDTLVRLLIAGQIAAWTLAPSLTHLAPPLDVVEGYMWGREWVIATYKHPALPSWVLEASRVLIGAVGWPAYLASQLFVAATFALVYRLGCDLMGRQRAAAGTLLLTGIVYYSWPTPEFNHNVAQTMFWAGFAFALWRAVERRTIGWWLLLGAFGVGGIYSKLSTGLLFVAAAMWMALDARARRSLATPGPWIALAVIAVSAAPLGLWLIDTDFAMLKYAADRTYWSKPEGIRVFVLSAIGTLAGMLAILAVATIGRRPAAASDARTALLPVDPRALRFLVVLVAVPPLIILVAAVLTQSGLKAAWASSMFNLAGLLAVALAVGRFDAEVLKRIALVALTLVVAIPIAYGVVHCVPLRPSKPPLRVLWPGAEIAARMAGIWDRDTRGAPLRIVAGDTWIAGLVGLSNKDRPHLLSNADIRYSPWIGARQLEAQGMLVLWEYEKTSIDLLPYTDPRKSLARTETFKSAYSSEDIVIGYIVVPPRPSPR